MVAPIRTTNGAWRTPRSRERPFILTEVAQSEACTFCANSRDSSDFVLNTALCSKSLRSEMELTESHFHGWRDPSALLSEVRLK